MLFEPLADLLRTHGEKLQEKLGVIRTHLAVIAENTEAQITRNQWVFKSVESEKEGINQLRNNEAYGWLVRDVAATVEVEVLLNSNSGEGFLCLLKKGERENVHWYVPPGSILIVKNLGKAAGFVNLNIENMVTSAKSASTGKSEEHIDSPIAPTVPSGHPLEEPQIGVRT